MDIDLEELAAIIELLDKAEFSQFRFEKGDLRIAVSRNGALLDSPSPAVGPSSSVAAAVPPVSQDPVATTPNSGRVASVTAAAGTAGIDESTLAADQVLVRSPMLGILYRSPKPGEPPYVKAGDKVDADSVLCIVEVMKLMNSVTAGVAGEISTVLVNDADLVEFDQPLFVVRRLS